MTSVAFRFTSLAGALFLAVSCATSADAGNPFGQAISGGAHRAGGAISVGAHHAGGVLAQMNKDGDSNGHAERAVRRVEKAVGDLAREFAKGVGEGVGDNMSNEDEDEDEDQGTSGSRGGQTTTIEDDEVASPKGRPAAARKKAPAIPALHGERRPVR